MTIRIRPSTPVVDPERFATLLTPALISTPNDDAPAAIRPGDMWRRWSDAHAPAPVASDDSSDSKLN